MLYVKLYSIHYTTTKRAFNKWMTYIIIHVIAEELCRGQIMGHKFSIYLNWPLYWNGPKFQFYSKKNSLKS